MSLASLRVLLDPKRSSFVRQLMKFSSLISPTMTAEKGRSDHLTLTADSFRREAISLATVCGVEDLSSTVKKLTLEARQPSDVTFKAGQWVDFFIPSISTVGGFSMCSPPEMLKEKGQLELAIKYSPHPPANWVHTQCQPGAMVGLKVGGNFFFDPSQSTSTPSTSTSSPASSSPSLLASRDTDNHSLLLIAGGVGINPLVSILKELSFHSKTTRNSNLGRCLLLYSAAREEELLFKDEIDEIVKSTAGIDVRYFVTREKKGGEEGEASTSSSSSSEGSDRRRIDFDYLRNEVFFRSSSGVNVDSCRTYVCGPPSMIDDVVRSLVELGVDERNVFYEKWW